jgi:hypothetical protein
MTGLEGTRRESYGLDESKAITSEMYVSLASEPFGRWPTGRNRLVLYCICYGKAASDGQKWTPNMDTVRATIRFAIATGRLEQR